MTFLKKLFGKAEAPARKRICVECGDEHPGHKDWCSIYRGQQEMAAKGAKG